METGQKAARELLQACELERDQAVARAQAAEARLAAEATTGGNVGGGAPSAAATALAEAARTKMVAMRAKCISRLEAKDAEIARLEAKLAAGLTAAANGEAAAQAEAQAVQTPGNANGAPPPTPPTAVDKALAAPSAADAEQLRRELKDTQRALREARQSLNFAHSEEGKTHLKSVLAKYIEVDDGVLNSDGPFEVLCTVLGYSAEEKQRMVAARRRKKEASAGLWGRVVGS